MSESAGRSTQADWTVEWIEKQREWLRAQSTDAQSEAASVIGARWRELGDTYLQDLAMLLRQDPAGGRTPLPPFKVGRELLDAWRSTWTAVETGQQGILKTFADLAARVPPLGPAREHAMAWRELAAAQAECQRLERELRAVLLGVQQEALDLLERRIREREAAGQVLASFRDLYDLWVESAEQIYATVAHSDAFAELQAQLGNATLRLRGHQQKVIEYALRQFDLPTRSELNSVHQQLRQLKQQLAALKPAVSSGAARRKPGPPRTPVRRKRSSKR